MKKEDEWGGGGVCTFTRMSTHPKVLGAFGFIAYRNIFTDHSRADRNSPDMNPPLFEQTDQYERIRVTTRR